MNKIKQELKSLEAQELAHKVDEYRRELFSLRLQSVTQPPKDKMQLKNVRKNIARALTYLHEKLENTK